MTEQTPSGLICINKPKGMTSHDAVNRIRKLYNTKKVGHTGTLDPMAEGVLIVLIGRAAKASDYLLSQTKEYIAKIKLGVTSDTLDITGNVVKSRYSAPLPDAEKIKETLKRFEGDIMQTPPMYSAIKIDGKKLYELARQGVSVERQARQITIHALEYLGSESDDTHIIRISCSKGTYIRTLCDDIGAALECGALMSGLVRTKNGVFTLDNCFTFEELEEMSHDYRYNCLTDIQLAFDDCQKVALTPFFERLARCGNEIYLKKISFSAKEGELVRLYGNERFFALGKVSTYPDGLAIKPVIQFDI